MNNQRSKPELVGLEWAVLLSIGFGICGAIVGFVVGLGMDISGIHINEASNLWAMNHGLWIGAVVGVIVFIVTNLLRRKEIKDFERSEEKHRQAEMARRQAEQDANDERKKKEDQQERERCLAVINAACEDSVARFEMLPADLKIAYDWLLEAQRHFRNNAYSPFWQAIEYSYSSLGHFNMRISYIETLARRYSDAVQDYRKVEGSDCFPLFPVQMDMAKAARASETIVSVANGVVYRAQCEAIFAQIWEQRRTTAAVVVGFANLQQAVAGMAHSVEAATNLLASTLSGMPSDVGQRGTEAQETKLRMNQAAQSLYDERWRASPLS